MKTVTGIALFTLAAAACTTNHQVGGHPLVAGSTGNGARCADDRPEGTFPCIASSATVGYAYDCCGGALPTQSCGGNVLECRKPQPGGIGVCVDRSWPADQPKAVCINREPGDNTCDRWSVLASASECGHYTQCGGAIYDLICKDGACSCFVNGETRGPFPTGDACESETKGAAANVRLCGAP
jgi:hypothetical protein